jgi:hypothetical protein
MQGEGAWNRKGERIEVKGSVEQEGGENRSQGLKEGKLCKDKERARNRKGGE